MQDRKAITLDLVVSMIAAGAVAGILIAIDLMRDVPDPDYWGWAPSLAGAGLLATASFTRRREAVSAAFLWAVVVPLLAPSPAWNWFWGVAAVAAWAAAPMQPAQRLAGAIATWPMLVALAHNWPLGDGNLWLAAGLVLASLTWLWHTTPHGSPARRTAYIVANCLLAGAIAAGLYAFLWNASVLALFVSLGASLGIVAIRLIHVRAQAPAAMEEATAA